MGRFSRNRTAKQRKRKKDGDSSSSSSSSSDSGGGSLMSMREGLKSVAGTSDKPQSKTGSILTWVILGVLVIALVSFFFAR